MSRVQSGVGRLNARGLVENLFHDPIIRIDYPLDPYTRGELPHIEIISGSHYQGSTSDPHQRLLVWRQEQQWDVFDQLPSNDIHCWDLSDNPTDCLSQMEAVLGRWSEYHPAWLQNQNVVVTVDDENISGRRDNSQVTLALIRHISRLYEGLRAEIIAARLMGIRSDSSRRLVGTPYLKWYESCGMSRTQVLTDQNMLNIRQALHDLMERCNRQIADEIERLMGEPTQVHRAF